MNEKIKTYDSKMTKTINNLDGELATIRAGRANPHVLDKLTVDYYGTVERCVSRWRTYLFRRHG